MIALGLDPSSSKCGIALVKSGEPSFIGVWKPAQSWSQLDKLLLWGDQVQSYLSHCAPDIVVIEECAPHRNAQTFRALVRFEAVASYEVKRHNAILLLHRVTEARKLIVGRGNTPKQEVFYEMKSRYPDLDWLPIDKGGDDQSDALVMALAAPQLAERR